MSQKYAAPNRGYVDRAVVADSANVSILLNLGASFTNVTTAGEVAITGSLDKAGTYALDLFVQLYAAALTIAPFILTFSLVDENEDPTGFSVALDLTGIAALTNITGGIGNYVLTLGTITILQDFVSLKLTSDVEPSAGALSVNTILRYIPVA